jgi:solute:Na+ symporter, SSS family
MNLIIIVFYILMVTATGLFFAGRNESKKDYFLSGKSAGWGLVGISIMVTAFSTLNFVAVTAEVFSFGVYVLLSVPMFFIIYFPVSRWFFPFYRDLPIISAYQYLEIRFDKKVRVSASLMFIIWKMIWMSVSLYAAGAALSAVSGLSVNTVILVAGITSILYTVNGGMKAVMITDMFQFIVLFLGVCLILGVSYFSFEGGLGEVFSLAYSTGSLKPFAPFDTQIFSPHWSVRISIWSTILGTGIAFLARYGVDQVVVQRYLAAKSPDDIKKGFLLNAFAAVFVIVLIAVFGLFVKAYAVKNGIALPPLKTLALFMNSLPPGLAGLLSAGLLAAMMSSIDSGINSCATAFFTDIYPNFSKKRVKFSLNKAKIISAVIGLISVAFAFPVPMLGSLFETVNKVVNGMGAPLLALFVAGMALKKVTAESAFYGFITGVIASILVIAFVDDISLHYYAVINFGITFGSMFLYDILKRISDYCQTTT